jgi:tRNA threonylcarbamoyladenosine modification (KEOPS) complex Cgi121 subunit
MGARPLIFAKAYACGPGSDMDLLKRELAAANPGALVQAAKGGSAENEFFVEMLAAQTLRAETSKSMLANKPEIDLLLRLAGTTQISQAIKGEGARRGEPFLLMAAGRSALTTPRVLEGKELPRTGLTKAELAKVEKAALLGTRRL